MGNPFSGGGLTDEQRRIVDYAKRHSDGAAITLAVNSPAMMSANYIIGTDETVIGMGGFMGTDPSPSLDQLTGWVADGRLKFVLSSASGASAAPPGRGFGGGMSGDMGALMGQRQQWVEQHCTPVDPAAYGGSPRPATPLPFPLSMVGGGQTLYQCHA
ncbi:hypothetical protein [Amycolatopsis mediterranei]